MNATLTEVPRKQRKLVIPIIHGNAKLTISKVDRKGALAALRAIGPVRLPSRR